MTCSTLKTRVSTMVLKMVASADSPVIVFPTVNVFVSVNVSVMVVDGTETKTVETGLQAIIVESLIHHGLLAELFVMSMQASHQSSTAFEDCSDSSSRTLLPQTIVGKA